MHLHVNVWCINFLGVVDRQCHNFMMIMMTINFCSVSAPAVGSDVSHLSNLVELNLSNNLLTTLCPDDFILLQQLKVS